MSERIRENLTRQEKALGLLVGLLQEEFSLLREGKPQEVTGLEMSIQELIRQIAEERAELKRRVLAARGEVVRLGVFVADLPEAEAAPLQRSMAAIDGLEQACARQADKNSRLALALFDQSRDMLQFIHDQIAPKRTEVYSRTGKYAGGKTQAAILLGST